MAVDLGRRPEELRNEIIAQGKMPIISAICKKQRCLELLKDKLSQTTSVPVFISSVVRDQQILHRVRLGPISNQGEAEQLQSSVRVANLGQPTLVRGD